MESITCSQNNTPDKIREMVQNLKLFFHTNISYNSSNVWTLPIGVTFELLDLEMICHIEKNNYGAQTMSIIEKIRNLRKKYNFYDIHRGHFNNKFDTDVIVKTNECSDCDLLSILYSKIESIIDELIKDVDYDVTKVSLNGKTSVILIAYTTDLYEVFCEMKHFHENDMSHFEINNIMRNDIINEEMKPFDLKAKGSWKNKLEI